MIVEYKGGGWNRVHLPERGGLNVYPDGLLNVMDANGRCVEALHGAATLWLDEDKLFDDRPEYHDDAYGPSKDTQPKVTVYFPDLNARLGASYPTVEEAFAAVQKSHREAVEHRASHPGNVAGEDADRVPAGDL